MNLNIRLPGFSPESDLSLAPQAATLAVTYLQGNAQSLQPPVGANNACASDPACEFLGYLTDQGGKLWQVYFCDGDLVMYAA